MRVNERAGIEGYGKGVAPAAESEADPTRTPPNDGSPGTETEATRHEHSCRDAMGVEVFGVGTRWLCCGAIEGVDPWSAYDISFRFGGVVS